MTAASARAGQPVQRRADHLVGRLLAALPLLLPYLLFSIFYAWQAGRHGTPWIFTDELEFTQLARSVAENGELARRGEPLEGQFSLYPYLTAPAWFLDDAKSAYEAAKLIGVLGMTLALFPAYGLARLAVSRPAALLVALASTAIPAFAYTSVLVEEPLAYPWATLCLFLVARWYAAPAPGRLVAAAAVCVAAPLFRDQFAVLPLLLGLVAAVHFWRSPRARSLREGWTPGVYVALLALAAGGLVLLEREYAARSVQWYTVTRVFPERLLEYGVWAAGAFTIGVGVLPVVAALAFLVPAGDRKDAGVAALRLVLLGAVAAFGVYTAAKAAYVSTVFADRVSERNLIYLSPLVFSATAVVLERRRVRLAALAGAALAVWYLLTRTPYNMDVHFYSDAPGLAILSWLNRERGWTPEYAQSALLWILAASLALLLALALLRTRPRAATPLALAVSVLVLGWNVADQSAASAASNSFSRDFLRNLPQPVDWLDRATGGEPAVYLGQKISDANGLWLLEFWNRSLKRIYSLDGSAPGPGPSRTPDLLSADGTLAADPGYRWVVAENSVDLVGKVVETKGGWRLYRIEGPLRLERSQRGIFSDGWVGSQHPADRVTADYSRFATPGNATGTLFITVSRKAWCGKNVPGYVLMEVGPLALGPERNGTLRSVTEERGWVVQSCGERVFPIPTPKPPFHARVSIEPTFVPFELDPSQSERRRLGAKVNFEWLPGDHTLDEYLARRPG